MEVSTQYSWNLLAVHIKKAGGSGGVGILSS